MNIGLYWIIHSVIHCVLIRHCLSNQMVEFRKKPSVFLEKLIWNFALNLRLKKTINTLFKVYIGVVDCA